MKELKLQFVEGKTPSHIFSKHSIIIKYRGIKKEVSHEPRNPHYKDKDNIKGIKVTDKLIVLRVAGGYFEADSCLQLAGHFCARLPNLEEFKIISENLEEINKLLLDLGEKALKKESYWVANSNDTNDMYIIHISAPEKIILTGANDWDSDARFLLVE